MNEEKPCKRCGITIELRRPKWAHYCVNCGRARSRDWKREHPEDAKNPEASARWRATLVDKTGEDWNAYMRRWRRENYARYREQNNKHIQNHRAKKRQQQRRRAA